MTSDSRHLECYICSVMLTELAEGEEPAAGPSSIHSTKRARVDQVKLKAASCGHVFHAFCITKWLTVKEKQPQCPHCNQPTTMETLRDIYFDFNEDVKCRNCNWRATQLDEMRAKVEEMEGEKKKLEGEKNKLEENVQEKDNELEMMERLHTESERKIEEKEMEVEKLEENERAMETDLALLKMELARKDLEFETAKDKLSSDFDEKLKEEITLKRKVENKLKSTKKLLKLTKEELRCSNKRFLERMEKRVKEKYQRLQIKQRVNLEGKRKCADLSESSDDSDDELQQVQKNEGCETFTVGVEGLAEYYVGLSEEESDSDDNTTTTSSSSDEDMTD